MNDRAQQSAFPNSDNCYGGLTLREYYAAAAMQGMLASGRYNGSFNHEKIHEDAFFIADNMIEASKKDKNETKDAYNKRQADYPY